MVARTTRPRPAETPTALANLEPMLLCEVPRPFNREGWGFELKYDGWRCLAEVRDRQTRLHTRRGNDATRWWEEVARGLAQLEGHHILDGEVCVLDEYGRSDFERLQARSLLKDWKPDADMVVYCVFDLLVYNGQDIMRQPLQRRKADLADLLSPMSDAVLRVGYIPSEGQWLFERALELHLEGIVAKDLSSTYQPGVRSRHWLKIKRPGAVPPERFHFGSR